MREVCGKEGDDGRFDGWGTVGLWVGMVCGGGIDVVLDWEEGGREERGVGLVRFLRRQIWKMDG